MLLLPINGGSLRGPQRIMCSGVPAHVDPWGGSSSAVIWASLNCCRRITHASPDPEAGRPANPGQEIDQGAAIGPKVRQTAALMAPVYLKRPATAGHGNSVGFRRLRVAPDAARKAA
jgi:hypothetical protein